MIGISVYISDLDYDYILKAKELGARYIFTSLHIKEENYAAIESRVHELIKFVNNYDMELIPDISPITFEKLGIENKDYQAIKDLGFKTVRLDYGFDDFDEVRTLQELFTLVLNASIVNEEYIIKAKQVGINFDNIYVMHNYYPKTDTGLSDAYFRKMNEAFIKHNIKIMAFLPGDNIKRFPLYEGLPTLEKHRNMHPFIAALDLIENYQVKEIFIGDSKAKIETLEMISLYLKNKTILIPIELEKRYEYLYNKPLKVRRDQSDVVVRIQSDRVDSLPIVDNNVRPKGTLTIENTLSGRYCGEIQLTRKNMKANAGSNVIGHIKSEFVDIVEYVDGTTTLIFVK